MYNYLHLALVAVSGTGKGTVIKSLMQVAPEFQFAVSVTTRKPREGEIYGVNYYFWPRWKFFFAILFCRFVEWNYYTGNFYGTLKSEIRKKEKAGIPIIFDVDINGAMALKKFLKEKILTIFLDCPIEESERRLRGRDIHASEKYIRERMDVGKNEILRQNECDTLVFYGKGVISEITANEIQNLLLVL